jgi:5,10-methylenetetrahydrofolate reductase
VSVPEALIQRLEQAREPREEGIRIAVELTQQLREIDGLRGVHLQAIEWESAVPQVVEQAGLLPRPVV